MLQRNAVPFLHAFDKCSAKDTNLNLAVLWWKSISGNKLGSSTFDGFVAYDMLPDITRIIVGFPFCWLYPNLHHQNVALRTAFLDQALVDAIVKNGDDIENSATILSTAVDERPPRIVTLGAGFDTRSLRYHSSDGAFRKLKNSKVNADFYEIDLCPVVDQKMRVFERFLKRRPKSILPKLYGADLNDIEEVQKQLSAIFSDFGDQGVGTEKRPTVFIVEAVLMYLKEENVLPLLKMAMSTAAKHSTSVKLCFADRLPGMPHDDKDVEVEKKAAVEILSTIGLRLKTWQPKPGRARHMGIAEFII